MGKKKKQKQARPVVTDVAAVRNADGEFVVSRSFSEVVDLLSEGVIEGLASGDYNYVGKAGETGYESVSFSQWTATGVDGPTAELGFLQSIYWNRIPVVDKDGFYNFASVNVETTKGLPEGAIPNFNPLMNSYADFNQAGTPSASDVLDLSVNRPVGERLYGPEIQGGESSPTDKIAAQLKPGVKIDKYAKTYTILNKELQKLAVNIKINALFESLQAGPKTYKKSKYLRKCNSASSGFGDQKARTIEYNIYYRPVFDQRFSPADQAGRTVPQISSLWQGPIKETVTGRLDQPYIRSTLIDLSDSEFSDSEGFEGWEIRIVRITPEPLTSFYRAVSFVDGFVEIFGTKLRYPYSSMTYSQFDARNFSRVPSRAYDAKLIKVKIPNNYNPFLKTYGKSSAAVGTMQGEAGSQISDGNRTNSNYVGISSWSKRNVIDPEWDGGFATIDGSAGSQPARVWTDNPAWCFYDLITNPRYGLGEFIDESQVDKWSLYEIAKYCDELVPDTYGSLEPRFTINYLITSREEAFKVLNDLTSIFRGIAYYSNGSIFAVQDRYKSAVYQFNNSNVLEGDFTYSSSSKRARHSVAIVRYNDKRNLFQPAIEYVEDEESVRRYGISEVETTALGCTSRGQARRFADWILKSEALETETVSFSVGADGAYLRPGDVVQIYDNFRSPLKYSGRTNAAIKGSAADVTSTNGVATQQGNKYSSSSNFNTIILDQGLNFTSDKSYKFSLLTPTYNTATGDETEVRRSQIQTATFSGVDAMPITGNFRSDETGVCTQITFNTGTLFGGTGNAFDFDNYVITGYINTGVWVKGTVENMRVEEQGYSGGCFSGENLIWSIEPTDKNDTEFISGHYSNYKVINIKEEEDTYSISALAYSTGKYNAIEDDKVTSASKIDPPSFLTGDSVSSSSSLSNATLDIGTMLNISQDTAFAGSSTEVSDADPYDSIKVTFSVAAASLSDVKEVEGKGPTANKKSYIIKDGIKQDELPIKYVVALFTDINDIPSADQVTNDDTLKIVDPLRFADYTPYITETIPNESVPHRLVEDNVQNNQMVTEYLTVPNITTYWIAVFALSENGACSYGMIRRKSGIESTKTVSEVQGVSITNLTSEGIEPANIQTVNLLESVEPGFSWQKSTKGVLFSTPSDEPNHFEVSLPDSTNQYRITLREPAEATKPNTPSDQIYLEFTGYQSLSNEGNFVFERTFNDPNSIKSIITGSGYGWKERQAMNGTNGLADWIGLSTDGKYKAGADWFSASGNGGLNEEGNFEISGQNYGVNINSGLAEHFPLREFDIVVEAQGGRGFTSAGNEPYEGTLLGGAETFPSNSSYDIFGAKIEAPSGVFFAQTIADKKFSLRYGFIDPFVAGEKLFPYVASAAIFPNGYLEIQLQNSITGDAQLPVMSEDEIDIFFNNSAGLIYYYTTGDNRIDYIDSVPRPLNRAPSFVISPDGAALFSNENKFGSISQQPTAPTFYEAGDNEGEVEVSAKAFGGVVDLAGYTGNYADGGKSNVHRGFYLFSEGDTLESLRIPFPNINKATVENINLAFGFIDDLHVLSAFEEDGQTPILLTPPDGEGLFKTPKIFSEKSVNYSTVALQPDSISFQKLESKYSNLFVDKPGNSMFLNESSITSAGDTALAFRAWGEINIENSEYIKKHSHYANSKRLTLTRDFLGVRKIVTKNIPSMDVKVKKQTYKIGNKDHHNYTLIVSIQGVASVFDEKKISVVLGNDSAPVNQFYEIIDGQIVINYRHLGVSGSFTFGILVTNE